MNAASTFSIIAGSNRGSGSTSRPLASAKHPAFSCDMCTPPASVYRSSGTEPSVPMCAVKPRVTMSRA